MACRDWHMGRAFPKSETKIDVIVLCSNFKPNDGEQRTLPTNNFRFIFYYLLSCKTKINIIFIGGIGNCNRGIFTAVCVFFFVEMETTLATTSFQWTWTWTHTIFDISVEFDDYIFCLWINAEWYWRITHQLRDTLIPMAIAVFEVYSIWIHSIWFDSCRDLFFFSHGFRYVLVRPLSNSLWNMYGCKRHTLVWK